MYRKLNRLRQRKIASATTVVDRSGSVPVKVGGAVIGAVQVLLQ